MAKPKKYQSSGTEPDSGSVRVGTGGGGGGGTQAVRPLQDPKASKKTTPPKGGSKTSKGA
ncbi:MAG: hypothetical protein QOH06_3267 [Acidobacteriota bacterium]|jgi:hypothetical protein|nr:hypothetical protein [Acidobacteriota bacterium]